METVQRLHTHAGGWTFDKFVTPKSCGICNKSLSKGLYKIKQHLRGSEVTEYRCRRCHKRRGSSKKA